jgi:hypothetical protein
MIEATETDIEMFGYQTPDEVRDEYIDKEE